MGGRFYLFDAVVWCGQVLGHGAPQLGYGLAYLSANLEVRFIGLAFALNRIGTPAEEVAARVYLQQAGYTVLDGSLRDRPAYRQAQNTGHSVTETRFAGLNERADTLIQSLIDRVTHG